MSLKKIKKGELFESAYVPFSSPKNKKLERGFKFPALREVFKHEISEVEIFPTRNCSENCEGCSVPKVVRWGQERRMSVSWWQKFIQKTAEKGVKYIMIMGGEPTVFPGIEKIIKTIVECKVKGGIFTDGIPLRQNPKRLELLVQNGLLKMTIHSSVDYLVKKEPPLKMGRKVGTSRYHKSFYGLELLKALKAREAKGVVANTVLSPANLKQIIPLYQELERQGIKMTLCNYQWQCHLYQGRDPKLFTDKLVEKHIPQVREIIGFILRNEKKKIKKGKERTMANSSRFLRALPYLGIAQPVGCNNSSGPPGVFAVLPDGSLRHCPVITRLKDIPGCPGCHYGFRDRSPKLENYLAEMKVFNDPDRLDFPNIIHEI